MPVTLPIDRKLEDVPPGFQAFWEVYPRKTGKKAALSAWKREGCEPYCSEIVTDVKERIEKHPQWTKDDGRFIPHPATYINQHRWTDEIPEQKEDKRAPSKEDIRRWARQQEHNPHPGESWESYDLRITRLYQRAEV